jgi:hypothetical protein
MACLYQRLPHSIIVYIKPRRRVFLAISFTGVITVVLFLATYGISESYSQSKNTYCLGFRQDYSPIIDCFVSDKLCQEFATDLSSDVRILAPCHGPEE